MKKFLTVVTAALAAISPVVTSAAAPATPAFTLHTRAYEVAASDAVVSIVLGATSTASFTVECAGDMGPVTVGPAAWNPESGAVDGTIIYLAPDAAGQVTIYGDPSLIDYLDATGCYITDIDLSQLTSLDVLTLSHNEISHLDLTPNTLIRSLELSDNPYDQGLIIGPKPGLVNLDLSLIEGLDPAFNLSDYPQMVTFDAWGCHGLTALDPTGCPNLLKLSIDNTYVASLDLSQNPKLRILNIGNSRITSIDLSHNPDLLEFYADSQSGTFNAEYRLSELDVTHNPLLYRLFCSGNNISSIDLSHNPYLEVFSANYCHLTALNLDANQNLQSVYVRYNDMDFATLPPVRDTYLEYEYAQRPFPVDRSYAVGTELDFSSRVLRQESYTEAAMFSCNRENPFEATPIDPSYYSYADGKITLLRPIDTDSIYIAFANSAFPDALMTTTAFMVKSEADFGKPSVAVTLRAEGDEGDPLRLGIGIVGATVQSPRTVYVDLGDGTTQPFEITTDDATGIVNVAAARTGHYDIRILTAEGDDLSSLSVTDQRLYAIDLSHASAIRSLTLARTDLYDVDLQWNSTLTYLDLSGNNLTSLDLSGTNYYYSKNLLSHIDLSHNKLTALTLSNAEAINYLDLSYNRLSALQLTDGDNVHHLDVSHNALESLALVHYTSMEWLNCSDNHLTSIILPEPCVATHIDISRNYFDLVNLPVDYLSALIYAPQHTIAIPAKGPGADLSAQYVVIDGQTTVFSWFDADGTAMIEGTDYTVDRGDCHFLSPMTGRSVHCVISHPMLPQFVGDDALTTSAIEAAALPTHMLAEFVTPTGGQHVTLSLAAAEADKSIYIAWDGSPNNMVQYPLTTTYTLFEAFTTAGATVRVYSYDTDDQVTVFSLSGCTMSSFDGSGFTAVRTLTLHGAGLSSVILPDKSKLTELNLEGNAFESFDLTGFSNLDMLSMSQNKLTDIDLSPLTQVQGVYLAGNKLTNITIDNPRMWVLALSNNDFESIDLSHAPWLENLDLSHNRLSTIDLSSLSQLRAVMLDNNRFDFATLPVPQSSWIVYNYASQAPIPATCIDARVDLSAQASFADTPTEFAWFVGEPWLDETGLLAGEQLIEGDDYLIEGGITTFLRTISGVCCAMTNEALPYIVLTTELIDVNTGLSTISNDSATVTAIGRTISVAGTEPGSTIGVYSIDSILRATAVSDALGSATVTDLPAGLYLVLTTDGATKVALR